MDVREYAISKLKPYENNPRINDDAVDAVEESIRRYGWKQPIVIDKDGVIVVGHTRYKAAVRLGCKTVPCVVADDLTPEEIKEYRLVDNKTNEIAEWDFEKLDAELAELDFDYDFGFSESGFDWEDVGTISDSSYEAPDKDMLQCPVCGAIDSKERFKKA